MSGPLMGTAVASRAARPIVRIERWFAQPAPAERLAAFRVLLGLFTLSYLLVRLPVLLELADGRPSRFEPVGVLAFLDEPLPAAAVFLLLIAAVGAALAFTAGWRFRVSGPVLALAMLLLGTYRSSWGQLLHFENMMVLHLLVVALSPAADVWSVDRRRRDAVGPSIRYGLPLRVAALVTVITYVLAGVAKLRYGGLEWMLGDTLQNHVAYSATRLDLLGGTASPIAELLVGAGWLFPPLAVATVVIELAAPVALVSGRARGIWVASAWSMHVGILALMLIVFPYPLFGLAFAPLYEVERLARIRPARRILAATGADRLLATPPRHAA